MKLQISPATIRQYVAVFVINLSIFTTGMSFAWPSPVLVKLRDAEETPLSRPMTEEEGSWMVSLGFLCGILSVVVGGQVLDIVGRKNSLLLSAVPKISMGILFIFATEAWMLVLGRTIMVLTDCYLFLVVPVYSSEIADKEQRGALGSSLQFFASFGGLITLCVGPYTSYRTFNVLFTMIIIITSIPFLWLPESPAFLYRKGNLEAALKVLNSLRKSYHKPELNEYEVTHEPNQNILQLFKDKCFLKSFALGSSLCIGVQVIGYNAVYAYLQTILETTHTNVRPETASVVIGILQVITSFSTILITKRLKRRTILLWSLIGYFLGMVGLGTFFQMKELNYNISGFLNYLPNLSMVLVIYSYSAGIGCLLWPVTAELFDNNARAFGVSTCLILLSFFTFITTKYFPFMNTALGPAGTYWFFCTMTAILTILLGKFLPETKGKSFHEIQKSLGKKADEIF